MDSEFSRTKPLTKEETKALVDLIEVNKIILSKVTNATTNKMKTEEWISVTNIFNAQRAMGCRRTPQQLRLKWENLKKTARKRSAKIRMNRIQTGGGVGEYIPPDEVLDKVNSLLGSTGSGYNDPFGGDREVGSNGDGDGSVVSEGSGEVALVQTIADIQHIGSDTLSSSNSVLVTEIPVLDDCGTSVTNGGNVCDLTSETGHVNGLHTLKALPYFKTPKTGRKKSRIADDGRAARNLALAEYYKSKKQCLDANLENIILNNDKLRLENEKLKLELEKLKASC